MASKCCSKCAHTFLLSSFLADPSDSKSKIRKTCIKCRAKAQETYKRKALEPLDPNIPSKRPTIGRTMPTEAPSIPLLRLRSETRPESSIRPVPLPESRPQTPLPIPILESRPQTPLPIPTPKSRPQTPLPLPPLPPSPRPPLIQPAGFLPADQ
jgi:hypothetical protein